MAEPKHVVDVDELSSEIPQEHFLVKFFKEKYKCIMALLLFLICGQQMLNIIIQSIKSNMSPENNLFEIVSKIKNVSSQL